MTSIPKVSTSQELVERFDARFGDKQFIPYMTQLPEWWESRDRNGRTPFMVGLACTKGATTELYLAPEAEHALAYRDSSGRNLWHYMWHTTTFGGLDNRGWDDWRKVMDKVPFGINPQTDRGLFTDSLLNHLPARENLSQSGRAKLFNVVHVGRTALKTPTQRARLIQWSGADPSAWWACPEHDAKALFDRALESHQWPTIALGVRFDSEGFMDRTIQATVQGRSEALPPPWRAILALGDLLLGNEDRGIKAMEDGALDGFLTIHDEARLGRINERLIKSQKGAVEKFKINPVAGWWAHFTERHMDLHLSQAPEQAPPINRKMRL